MHSVVNTSKSEQQPGEIITMTPMGDVDSSILAIGATATRISYRSTSGLDGSPTTVTGAFFIPAGDPPHGGWPVIAFAHGTTGINNECGPSQSPTLMGSINLVGGFLRLGYAVTASDYQGLGGPGSHPYLDAKTAGLNVIDSVRAIRNLSNGISKRWGVLGGSQGGAVAWAANEQASTYAKDLELVGSVSLAPAADVSEFANKAAQHTLNPDEEAIYVWLLMGLERTRPGFDINAYRHGYATKEWDVLSACSGPDATQRLHVLAELPPEDLAPSSPEAVERLDGILRGMALPQQRATAPMLIIYGDRDTYIDPNSTAAAIQRACAMGSWVAAVIQPDRGHTDVDPSEFSGWLMARFAGIPAPSTC